MGLTENHLNYIAVVFFVDFDRNSFSIVPDADRVVLLVDIDLDHVHSIVSLKVVSCIYKNLICKRSLQILTYRRFCIALEQT